MTALISCQLSWNTNSTIRTAKPITKTVEELSRFDFEAATGEPDFERHLPELGLHLNANDELRRDGVDSPVRLTALEAGIIGALSERHPKRLLTREVKQVWEKVDLVTPSDDTFYPAMKEFRETLKVLGLTCYSKPRRGYLLKVL